MEAKEQAVLDEPQNKQQDAAGAPQAADKPDKGREAVKQDVNALDSEFQSMQAEYNEILKEKQQRNANMAAKLKAVKSDPKKLLGERPDVAQYEIGQLAGYNSEQVRQMIEQHLENQIGDKKPTKFVHSWDRQKKFYIDQMSAYVSACRQGPNTNAGGIGVAHPATPYGQQIRGVIEILEITPFMEIEHHYG